MAAFCASVTGFDSMPASASFFRSRSIASSYADFTGLSSAMAIVKYVPPVEAGASLLARRMPAFAAKLGLLSFLFAVLAAVLPVGSVFVDDALARRMSTLFAFGHRGTSLPVIIRLSPSGAKTG